MSDTYTPSAGGFNDAQEANDYARFHELGNRMNYVTGIAPWLADDPEVLSTIAQMPVETDRLQYLVGSMSAQMRLEGTLTDLQRMEPGRARTVWSQLTATQQQALTSMGYQPPSTGNGGSNPILSAVGSGLGLALRGVNTVVTETPIVSDVFDIMNKLDNGVKTLYRTMRTDESAGLATAAAIVGGIAAAPFTGGLSLGVTGLAIGGSALAAGSAAAMLTNPSDYVEALQDNWNGETVFSRAAQTRARDLVRNSGLDVMARDLGWEMDTYETVQLFASAPDATSNQQFMASIERVLDRIAEKGDPRREELAGRLVDLIQVPEFREAVEVLQHSKVSFGRDMARLLNIDESSSAYNMVSGGLDALFTIVLDPTLAAGGAVKWNRARRLGVPIIDGEDAYEAVQAIARRANEVPSIGAAYDEIASAVDTDQLHRLWRRVPEARGLGDDLWNYKQQLIDAGDLDGAFTREHIFDWLGERENFARMLAGHGVKRGHGRLLLPTYGWTVPILNAYVPSLRLGERAKEIIDLADDAGNRAHLRKVAREIEKQTPRTPDMGVRRNLKGALRYSENPEYDNQIAAHFVRAIDRLPVINTAVRTMGSIMGAFTEMMPGSRAISMVGPQAFEDIQRLTGLGRAVGMTSLERKAWFDTIMQQDNIGHRINASISFLDTLLTAGGARTTEHGDELVNQFINKIRQRYSLGKADQYLMGERVTSRAIHTYQSTFDLPLPDLHELRRAAEKGMLLKYVYGVVDTEPVDLVVNKIWKPAVLLRLGFITRAAGEEMLAHLARAGPSSLIAEFGARSVAEGRLHSAALQSAEELEKLGPEAVRAIERMRYAAHVRPLERMFSNWEWSSPALDVLRRYTDFLRHALETGIAPGLAERVPASRQLALLGREGGWRRSLLTGIDPDLIRYAESFGRVHASTIMREVSSHNANIWSGTTIQDKNEFRLRFDSADGELRELGFVVERGRFKVYRRGDLQSGAGDDLFDRAAHGGLAQIVSDPVEGPAILNTLTRYTPPTLSDEQVGAALDVYRSIQDWRVKTVVDELLTANDGRTVNWDSALRQLAGSQEDLAATLRAAHRGIGDRPEEASAVFETLRQWTARTYRGQGGNLTAYGRKMTAQIDAAEELVTRIASVGNTERAWLGSFLDHWGRLDETPTLIRSFEDLERETKLRLADRHYEVETQPLVQNLSYVNQLDDGRLVARPPREGRTRLFVPQVTAETMGTLMGQLRASGPDDVVERLMALWEQAQPHLAGLHVQHAEEALRRFLNNLARTDLADLDNYVRAVSDAGKHGNLVPLAHMGFDDPDVALRFSQFLNGVMSKQGTELSMVGRMRSNKGYVAFVDLDDQLRKFAPVGVDGARRPVAFPAYQDRVTVLRPEQTITEEVVQILDKEPLSPAVLDAEIPQLSSTSLRAFSSGDQATQRQRAQEYLASLVTDEAKALRHEAFNDEWEDFIRRNQEMLSPDALDDVASLKAKYSDDPSILNLLENWERELSRDLTRAMEHASEEEAFNLAARWAKSRAYQRRTIPEYRKWFRQAREARARRQKLLDAWEAAPAPTELVTVTDTLPAVTRTDRTYLQSKRALHTWSFDPDYMHGRTVSLADRELIDLPDGSRQFGVDPREAINAGVAKQWDDLMAHIGPGTTQKRIVKGEVYWDDDAYELVPPGTELPVAADVYNRKGVRVEYDDAEAFTLLEPTTGNNLHENWTMLGPLLRDATDSLNGTARLVPDRRAIDNLPDFVRDARAVAAPAVGPNAREFRGHWSHMRDLPNPPQVAVGPALRPVDAPSWWDNILTFGFEKVISPSIDAIIRRPLAFHMYSEAMRENERAGRWMLSRKMFGNDATGEKGELWEKFHGILDDPAITGVDIDALAYDVRKVMDVFMPDEAALLADAEPLQVVNALLGRYGDDTLMRGDLGGQLAAAQRMVDDALSKNRAELWAKWEPDDPAVKELDRLFKHTRGEQTARLYRTPSGTWSPRKPKNIEGVSYIDVPKSRVSSKLEALNGPTPSKSFPTRSQLIKDAKAARERFVRDAEDMIGHATAGARPYLAGEDYWSMTVRRGRQQRHVYSREGYIRAQVDGGIPPDEFVQELAFNTGMHFGSVEDGLEYYFGLIDSVQRAKSVRNDLAIADVAQLHGIDYDIVEEAVTSANAADFKRFLGDRPPSGPEYDDALAAMRELTDITPPPAILGPTKDQLIAAVDTYRATGRRPRAIENAPNDVLERASKMFAKIDDQIRPFEVINGRTLEEWVDAIERGERVLKANRWTLPVLNNSARPIEGLLDAYVEHLGDKLALSWKEAERHLSILPQPMRDALDESNWSVLSSSYKNRAKVTETLEGLAAERAIANAMPYLDSHEIRSQAGEYVRGFFPFMYAEENFLKRWGRTLRVAPDALRKGQLLYMGLKSAGVVRTDSQGRDWFVYPGGGAIAQTVNGALQTIGIGEMLPSGVVFASETKNMLPGFDVERTGMPSANPLVAMPIGIVASMFHELRPVQEALVGQAGVAQGGVSQFIPTSIRRFWDIAGDEDSNRKYASAMMSAIAVLEHNGNGLPEGATLNQLDEYIRRVRNHTRGILAAQAFVGFITPGSPTIQFTGESQLSMSNLTGLQTEIPADVFRDEYLQLVQELGIEEGTAAYFELNPDHDVHDLIGFTVGQSRSTSGAPIPVTHDAVRFADENPGFMEQYPMAAAWLLPQPDPNEEDFDEYAYVQQAINGLRQRRTPTEFLEAIKYREGSLDYFKTREHHEQLMAEAEGDTMRRKMLEDVWSQYKARHLALHPVFAEQLEGGESRQRRARTLDELRVAIADPGTPNVAHLAYVRDLIQAFDFYKTTIAEASVSRTAEAQDRVARMKLTFENLVTQFLMEHPELEPLWLSVLRPEANL